MEILKQNELHKSAPLSLVVVQVSFLPLAVKSVVSLEKQWTCTFAFYKGVWSLGLNIENLPWNTGIQIIYGDFHGPYFIFLEQIRIMRVSYIVPLDWSTKAVLPWPGGTAAGSWPRWFRRCGW